MIITNGELSNREIMNYTARDTRRINMTFGVSYDDDIQKVRGILEKIVKDDKRILKDPETLIVVGNLGESSVDFFVRPWCKTDDYWDIKFDLLEKVELRKQEVKDVLEEIYSLNTSIKKFKTYQKNVEESVD